MGAGKNGGKGKPEDPDDIWFSGPNDNPKADEKMPNFQFYDDNRRTFLVVGSIVMVFLFAGILWFLYYQKNFAAPGEVPHITADNTPIKTRPLEPGGMDVPDRDKLIYDKVSGEETDLEERIQPSPEQPVGDVEGQTIEDLILETEPEKTVVAEAAPEPAVAAGVYVIQLGAFGEEAGADRAWGIFKDRYKSILADLTPDIQAATGSGGNVLYRLRAGFFANLDQAREVCRQLQLRGQECLATTR